LLQHGLTDSSAGFCLNGPLYSFPFILADAGYDVWLGNNRGNGYSMNNVNYGPTDPRFWDFSWDEMALIDFPANINYITTFTSTPKLSYVGHSEGTIQAFAGLISDPSIANKLNVYIALAPVAFVGGITIEIMQILSRFDADELLLLLGVNEFYLPNLEHSLLPEICRLDPSICGYTGNFFYGRDSYLNASMLDFYTIYEPFPTSSKNIIHWAQGVRSSTFRKYDYGTAGNLQHYGQTTPPVYAFSNYPKNLPTVLVSGGIDGLADPSDVSKILAQVPSGSDIVVINREDYGHLDPLLGWDAYQLTYPDLLKLINQYSGF
jgi:pimeloyl-ACP methyl ester carboxylesterase